MKEAVIGIITDEETGFVLALKRQDAPIWVFPGGGIDEGETPEEALIREVLEETGLEVAIKRKCSEYYPINHLAAKTHVYECTSIGGSLKCGPETKDLEFFPSNHFPKPFFPLHLDWLADAKKNPDKIMHLPIKISRWAIFKFFCRHPIIVTKFHLAKRKT